MTDGGADTLSVESLTLLPPADPPRLHPCAGQLPLALPRVSIPEEEEEEAESPADATVQQAAASAAANTPAVDEPGEDEEEEEGEGGDETGDDLPDSPELD